MYIVMLEGRREGYAPNQCKRTMTVGDLKEHLEGFDDDCPIMLKNDNGYTYGTITESSFEEEYYEDEEWEARG